jgi:hypothetical protein
LFEDRDIRRFLIHQIDGHPTGPERGVMQALSVMSAWRDARGLDVVSAGTSKRIVMNCVIDNW